MYLFYIKIRLEWKIKRKNFRDFKMDQFTIEKIEDFLKKPKYITKNYIWVEDKNSEFYKSTFVLNDDFDALIDFTFQGNIKSRGVKKYPNATFLLRYSPMSEQQRYLITRINIFSTHYHTNPYIPNCDASLLKLKKGDIRIYKWEDFKLKYKYNPTAKSDVGRSLLDIQDFQKGLQYFLNYANIKSEIDLPPYEKLLI